VASNCDIRIFCFPLIIYARCIFRRCISSDFGLYLVRGRRKFWRDSENCIPSCRLIELAAPNARIAEENLCTREEENIEERSKISPYVALLSETDNILWYTPIEGRISSLPFIHTHTHILSAFYFSFLRRFLSMFIMSIYDVFLSCNVSTTIHVILFLQTRCFLRSFDFWLFAF